MKLKQDPDDFYVEERTHARPGWHGPFAFYRLEKRGWSTPDALTAIRRRWDVELRQLSYGGLKDRHAHTIQYFTIWNGPRRGLHHHGVTVGYLGQLGFPYSSHDIHSNAFRITLRAFDAGAVELAAAAVDEVRRDGLPNYFDDQRFGSVDDQGEFIGRLLVQGRFEDALRLALAAPYEFDRAEQKLEKAVLQSRWGDWPTCKAELPRGHARSLVDYLAVHPGDYRGAVARLRPELRGLYLSAYQSHLWNRMLAAWIEREVPAEQRLPIGLRMGPVPVWKWLTPDQRARLTATKLPLPSARLKLAEDDPIAPYVKAVLAEEGLELRDLRVRGIRELFFSKGERSMHCQPFDLSHEWGDDDRHPGKALLRLAFALPRGSYATLIVKRITTPSPDR